MFAQLSAVVAAKPSERINILEGKYKMIEFIIPQRMKYFYANAAQTSISVSVGLAFSHTGIFLQVV